MPHYDYQCKNCDHTFEVFHSMSDKTVNMCPKCNGEVKRLIGGGAGVIFKGSGFYKTDYRNSDSKCENKNDSNPACSCCKSAESK